MDFEVALLDEDVRPHASEQVFLADCFSGVIEETNQEVECATADLNGLTVFEQQLTRRHDNK